MPSSSSLSISLKTALRLPPDTQLALVGAGGKTQAMFQLANELQEQSPAVLITTTTHLGRDQVQYAAHHLILDVKDQLPGLSNLPDGIICISGLLDELTERWQGLSPGQLEQLSRFARYRHIPLLVEADGSRQLPIKAPAEHEPVIPPFVDSVIVVAGLNGLHQTLDPLWVHRPQIFAQLSGLKLGEPVTPEGLAKVLGHPQGGLKGIPLSSHRICLLTHAETSEAQADSALISQLLEPHFQSIVIAANPNSLDRANQLMPYQVIAVHQPVAAIVLAAGASQRFGKPKQLLRWRGETLVHQAARVSLEAELNPVVVVCGAESQAIQEAVADLPVEIFYNPNWRAGQSTSIQAGLQVLPPNMGAAIFILVDQPFISQSVLRFLVEQHSHTLASIIGPMVDGQRSNPVLFDQRTFADLFKLQGDIGGRALFGRYPPQWVLWHDNRLLIDIDTPEAYQNLLEHYDE